MFTAFKLTNNGKALHIGAVNGNSIKFTKVAFGDGVEKTTYLEATELSNVVTSVPFTSYDNTKQNILNLKWELDTSKIPKSFDWCEYGLYAEDKDGNEVLYAYAYDNAPARLEKMEQGVIALYVGYVTVTITDTDNITVELGEYDTVTVNQFKEHTENANNPHNVTAEQVGLGKVENVSPSDAVPKFTEANRFENVSSGDKTSTLWGKVQKAISSLLHHMADRNNPHNVTAVQIGAAKTSHNHSANDITSGILGVNKGGTGVTSITQLRNELCKELGYLNTTNLDTFTVGGIFLIGADVSGGPGVHSQYGSMLINFNYLTSLKIQIYLPLSSGRYYCRRKVDNNNWTEWV